MMDRMDEAELQNVIDKGMKHLAEGRKDGSDFDFSRLAPLINRHATTGLSWLHVAAINNDVKSLTALLDLKNADDESKYAADPDLKAEEIQFGDTPAHSALRHKCNLEAFEVLLRVRKERDLGNFPRNDKGETPLMLAGKNTKKVMALYEKYKIELEVNAKDNIGRSVVTERVVNNDPDSAEAVLNAGGNPELLFGNRFVKRQVSRHAEIKEIVDEALTPSKALHHAAGSLREAVNALKRQSEPAGEEVENFKKRDRELLEICAEYMLETGREEIAREIQQSLLAYRPGFYNS